MPSLKKPKRPSYRAKPQQRGSGPLHPCYKDKRYRKARDTYKLSIALTCEVCGTVTERLDCDHAIKLTEGGAWFTPNNFLGLCKPCHGVKNGMERTGYLPDYIGAYGERVPVDKNKVIEDILMTIALRDGVAPPDV
jgi:5-methylcytosine-specific restriction endonuclease McrA